MIFRGKRLPAHLQPAFDAFQAVLAEIEPAKAELAEVMPSNRLPGRPLVEALHGYEASLTRARAAMPSWRRPEVEDEWMACDEGLARGLVMAARLREEAPDLGGFEGLLGTVQDLLDPLDPFVAAAERFVALRLRARPIPKGLDGLD